MAELVVEIGVEELPVSFVKRGLESMKSVADGLFRDARLSPGSIEVMGTPRRLTLKVMDVPTTQAERNDVVVGPPWGVAFRDGQPTKAAEGFARKNGVAVADLTKTTTDKGDYVSAQIHEAGRPAADILGELLPGFCSQIRFPKQMRWGAGEHAFGRPIHWIVALLDDQVIPFEFCGVSTGRETRGHRFLAPDVLSINTAADYEEALNGVHVLAKTSSRVARMRSLLDAAAKNLGGHWVVDEFLVQECATLVEEPFVVAGGFEPVFLELPDEVVVSVMRDHQRYFAVRNAEGTLMPHYLNVVNTAENPAVIALGNDRVLRARLADARFFVDEDRKVKLESRLAKLDNVVFQKQLGSLGDKVRRLEKVAKWLAPSLGLTPEKAAEAARLAKADLESLIVFEFPELQGEMGAFYARAEGIDADIAVAIAEHYRPTGADSPVPESALGSVVAIADRADTLVGCFGIGLAPKGNKDPFALRRAALALVRIAFEGVSDIRLLDLFDAAYDGFEAELSPKTELLETLDTFLRARLRAFYKDGFRGDVVLAAMQAWDGQSIRDLDARIKAVESLRGTNAFDSLATAFRRVYNITKGAPRETLNAALYEEGAEQTLASIFDDVAPKLSAAAAEGQYEEALRLVASELRAPIDHYFEDVMVMVEDDAVRTNRLSLLGRIADTVNETAHFHLLGGDA